MTLMRLDLLCLLVIEEDISFHSHTSRIVKASLGNHGCEWVECFNCFSTCNMHFVIVLSTLLT